MQGYIQVYTGNGKGKTTAALGLALRAMGAGLKVYIAQFVKGATYNEIKAMRSHLPELTLQQFGRRGFIHNKPSPSDIKIAQRGLREVTRIIQSGTYDVVILDEITIALFYEMFPLSDVIKILTEKPSRLEIIITGRKAPPELLEIADLVTEMKAVKHYYEQGVAARPGIEL